VTGTLGRINEGADGAIVTEMHISNTADYNNLTSGGDAVTATQVGNVITGAKSDGTVVFTFTYDENGNYTFTQKEPLDHNGRSETLIKLGFGYTITDADGDTASSALIVSIHDDEPIVVADTNSVSEAASGITTKSQISGNILTNDKDVDVDNDDAIEIIGLEMTSPQAISSTVATHTINGQLYEGFHITGVYGNIMVDAKSGEYIYNLYNDRDIVNELSEGEQVNETFSYTITDENGVTQVSTLTINITGTDDLPEFEVATVSSDVDNIDMTGLNFSSGFKFEADVKLDSASETFFRQQNNGSNSFLIEFGDADHNSPHNPGTYLQLYIPLVNGGVYKAVTIDSLTIDEWHSIEVNYDPINGATIFIDGQSVGLDDSMGDSPSAMVSVSDGNYTVGSTQGEDFNGVFKDVKITSLEDDSEIVPNLSGDEVLFIQDDVDDGITDMSALLQNAINEGQLLSSGNSIDEIDLSSGDHILSNISVGDVLAMTDSDNTLKIETDSGDTVKLDLTNEWTATGNIDVNTGLDIYEGVTDSSVKLLIDSLNVEDTNI
jgi:T1SS-143 domain-containing protein